MRSFTISALALAAGGLVSTAHAQFLIDPAGGTPLTPTIGSVNNVLYDNRPLGFTANYFGQPITTIDVSENGFLNMMNLTSGADAALPTGVQRICPMWDNLYVYPGQSVTERAVPGSYYSVTWQLGTYQWGHVVQEFQVVWFGAAQRLYGFDFLPDDIVFCYKSIGASPWNATIGLEGPGGQFVPLPGTGNGRVSDAIAHSLVPNFTDTVKWVLFRPNGTGGYDASIVPCIADIDDGSGSGIRDGGVTIDDLLYFLQRFESGC